MNPDEEFKYSYSSKPRAVQNTRSKSISSKPAPPNIMHDPRVVRGSVFASNTMISPRGSGNNDKSKRRKTHNLAKKNKNIYEAQKIPSYSFTPFSLDANLIEQAPVVPEREGFSQTDEFVRYVTPKKKIATADGKFQRPKVGIDSGTQIESSDKLFNFDAEVRPLLNVLVSKTLAQALAEVKEETEMDNVNRERRVLLGHKADAERTDRELEDKAKQALRDKEQKKRELELKRQRIRVMKEKVLAWQLARKMASTAMTEAYATLHSQGVFYDPLHRDLADWLSKEVYHGSDAKLNLRNLATSLLDDLLFNSLRRQSIIAKLLQTETEALVRVTLKDPISYTMVGEDGAECAQELAVIGPVSISRHDSLAIIEHKLQTWITENVGVAIAVPANGLLSLLSVAESI